LSPIWRCKAWECSLDWKEAWKNIEGFFKDNFSGRVQPVDIAKKLAREMRDNRRVSISNIYVPNEYTVFLHQSDWESISAFPAPWQGNCRIT
jgi:hypothetical protein